MTKTEEILLNNYAHVAFLGEADHDYIAARLAYRANLLSQFLWSSLQAVEKYYKCILLLNRVEKPDKPLGHKIDKALALINKECPFKIDFIDPRSEAFLKLLNDVGANRYLDLSQYSMGEHLEVLDRTVWSIRRYCKVLVHDFYGGKPSLPMELTMIKNADAQPHYRFRLTAGRLEKILRGSDSFAKEALLWQNDEYGDPATQPRVRRVRSQSVVSPLFSHPEFIDELVKYVQIAPGLADEYRALAASNAAQVKAPGAARKTAGKSKKPKTSAPT